MKTKYWIMLLAVIMTICIGLSIPLLTDKDAASYAEILSDGQVIRLVDLQTDQAFTVSAPNGGQNTITVKNGKIGVTSATCPDHYCMDRGMCDRGTQIVCLPNKLIIRFKGVQAVDSVVG